MLVANETSKTEKKKTKKENGGEREGKKERKKRKEEGAKERVFFAFPLTFTYGETHAPIPRKR